MAGQGFAPLERTAEDEAAGLYPIQAPGGPIVRLTQRQVDIMNMPSTQRHHVAQIEMVELGKILMAASQGSIDDALRSMDDHPEPAPEIVPEMWVSATGTFDMRTKDTQIRIHATCEAKLDQAPSFASGG